MHRRILVAIALGLALPIVLRPQIVSAAAKDYLNRPDAWFSSDEGNRILTNMLSWQSTHGDWPKNQDTTNQPNTGDKASIQGTWDNGATLDELRLVAHAFRATKEDRYKDAFLKGFDHVLAAQYPTGGWPQYHPLSMQYHRHITFNDGTMVRIMEFLRETHTSADFAFVSDERRKSAGQGFDKGVKCILKCQIVVDGKPTVWCAQHDEIDFRPQLGRAYELPSFSGSESVGIARLLMSLDDPNPEVIRGIKGAMTWFESAQVKGIKIVEQPDPNGPRGRNRVVVEDASAPPLWARFYDLKTAKPIFVDRDGVPKPALADIGYERRNGYAWYGNWPQTLLIREYPAWKKKWAERIAEAEKSSKEPGTNNMSK